MKKKTKLDLLKEDFSIILGERIMKDLLPLKGYDFNLFFKSYSQKLGWKWNKSDFSDYSYYSLPHYLIECCWTYLVSSQAAIQNAINYFNSISFMTSNNIIDVYSGVGLTTRLLLDEGFIVENVNCEKRQVDATKRLLEHHGYDMVHNYFSHSDVKRTFDIVICLETIEHFKNPIHLTEKLIDMTRNYGYLVETTSFCSPQHYGHFKEYEINGKLVGGRVASRVVHDLIRQSFELEYSGWNGRPRIYRKK